MTTERWDSNPGKDYLHNKLASKNRQRLYAVRHIRGFLLMTREIIYKPGESRTLFFPLTESPLWAPCGVILKFPMGNTLVISGTKVKQNSYNIQMRLYMVSRDKLLTKYVEVTAKPSLGASRRLCGKVVQSTGQSRTVITVTPVIYQST